MSKDGYVHRLDIFGTELRLATDPKMWKRLVKRHADFANPDVSDNSGRVESGVWEETSTGRQTHVVAIFIHSEYLRTLPELAAVIAHESTHAALRILEHASEPHNPDSEVLPYLVGWISQWVHERCPFAEP